MSYIVIARKYRPQKFSDIAAQEHVTRTLKNAIRSQRIAHGYIFSGSRGVGKTTAARILAKALNCEKIQSDTKYRTEESEPCGQCESCQDFDAGTSLNISEFDAASNNSVEDIRALRENVRYAPQKGQYKVYIIDEFHMLSNAAFNAFLKTLEEPPEHVVFIFATTEMNKVPPTISSRCQKFNFKRIAIQDIQAQLKAICEKEAIHIDDKSLLLIARKADGAMRDAQSLLDQVISFCAGNAEQTIAYETAAELLNDIDDELFFNVTTAITNKDAKAMLELSRFVFEKGYDPSDFLTRLIEHFRNYLTVINLRSAKLVEGTEESRARYESEAQQFSAEQLLGFVDVITSAEKDIKHFREPRLRFELALLKLTEPAQLGQLPLRIEALEKEIAGLKDALKKK